MKQNVEDEIATYVDLMALSLDACEILSENDLSGFLEREKIASRVRALMKSKAYEEYEAKETHFADGWPDMSARLSVQLALWRPGPPSPNDPILDPTIVGAI